jgi:hypothetical protein
MHAGSFFLLTLSGYNVTGTNNGEQHHDRPCTMSEKLSTRHSSRLHNPFIFLFIGSFHSFVCSLSSFDPYASVRPSVRPSCLGGTNTRPELIRLKMNDDHSLSVYTRVPLSAT